MTGSLKPLKTDVRHLYDTLGVWFTERAKLPLLYGAQDENRTSDARNISSQTAGCAF